jgi:outer membrane protein
MNRFASFVWWRAVVAATLATMALASPALAADPLTLEQALAMARSHPDRKRVVAETAAAEARVDQVDAGRWPQVSASASYQRSTSNFVPRPGSVPSQINSLGESSFETRGFWQAGLQASWLVYDFGQLQARIGASKQSALAAEQQAKLLAWQLDAGVRVAFAALQAAVALQEVAALQVSQQQTRLRQITAWVEAGRRPPIDLAQAKADLAQAEVQSLQNAGEVELAWAQLTGAMGGDLAMGPVAATEPAPLPQEEAPLGELVTEAGRQRLELQTVQTQQAAQQQSLGGARRGQWPSLSFSTSLTEAGQTLDALAWNWNAGLAVQWPIWRGGQVAADVREARAQLQVLSAREQVLLQQVRVEVQRAQVGVRNAKATLRGAQVAERLAAERLTLAEGRYTAGVGTLVEVSDAQTAVQVTAAQTVQAKYRLAVARAQLQLALGRG